MEKSTVMKAIKARLKYLDIVGGTESCEVKSIGEMVSAISNGSEELMAFENCKEENRSEFKRLSIELCADIMTMLSRSNDFSTTNSFFSPKDFKFGGELSPTKSISQMPSQTESLSLLNDVLSGKMPLYGQGGYIAIDPYDRFKKDYSHMINMVKELSSGDPACINGLYDIIVKNNRPGIAIEMQKIGLCGRARCLGFTAKLCKCDITKMDAVINAYKAGMLSTEDIKIECLEGRGKRFSLEYVFDNYK